MCPARSAGVSTKARGGGGVRDTGVQRDAIRWRKARHIARAGAVTGGPWSVRGHGTVWGGGGGAGMTRWRTPRQRPEPAHRVPIGRGAHILDLKAIITPQFSASQCIARPPPPPLRPGTHSCAPPPLPPHNAQHPLSAKA